VSALSRRLQEANVEGWSGREIARRSGDAINQATVNKYLNGGHPRVPSEEVLHVFSDVLGVPLTELRHLAGLPAGELGPYQPPQEANRLDERQRKALSELIRAIAAGQETADGTSTTGAGNPGANVHQLDPPTPPTMDDVRAGRAAAGRVRPRHKGDRQT
jgi:transcriptional regulator with XRE-family HTH domain